jgi:hypothetical protein
MEKLEKIAVLDSEVQAELVDSVLSERGIPHLLQSYHDSALDGIYQARSGWGHIEAPGDSRDEILAVIEELKRQASSDTAPQEPPASGQ